MNRYSTAPDGSNGFQVMVTGPRGGPLRVLGTYKTEAEAKSVADNLNDRASSEEKLRASGDGPV